MPVEDSMWKLLDALHLGAFFDRHNIPLILFPIAIAAILLLVLILMQTPTTPSTPTIANLTVTIEGAKYCNTLTLSIFDDSGNQFQSKDTSARTILFENLPQTRVYVSAGFGQSTPIKSQTVDLTTTNELTIPLPEDYCPQLHETVDLKITILDRNTGSPVSARVTLFDAGGSRQDTNNMVGSGIFEEVPVEQRYYLTAISTGYGDYNGKEETFYLRASGPTSKEIQMVPKAATQKETFGTLQVCTSKVIEAEARVYDISQELVDTAHLSSDACTEFTLPASHDYYVALANLPQSCALPSFKGPYTVSEDKTTKSTISLSCEQTGVLRAAVYGDDGKLLTQNCTIDLYYSDGTWLSTLTPGSEDYTEEVTVPLKTGFYAKAKKLPKGYLQAKSDLTYASSDRTIDIILVSEKATNVSEAGYSSILCGSKGDLNNDGKVSSKDLGLLDDLLKQIQAGESKAYVSCADLDSDGKITTNDAVCLRDLKPDCDSTCQEDMQSSGRYSPLEICNDGYDNDCDGQTDKENYFNTKNYEDLCSCNKDTPCDMIRDLSGGVSSDYSNTASCAKLSYLGSGYAWHTESELACNGEREGETKECGGTIYTCQSGTWQGSGTTVSPIVDTDNYELYSTEEIPLSDWPIDGRDLGNTNYYPSAIDFDNMGLLEKFFVSDDAISDFLIADGRVYTLMQSGYYVVNLMALDLNSGNKLWAYDPPGKLYDFVVYKKRIYFRGETFNAESNDHDTEYTIYCLNSESGTLLWEKTSYGNRSTSDRYKYDDLYRGILAGDDIIYTFRGGTIIVALDAATGQQLWEEDISNELLPRKGCGTPTISSPYFIDEDRLYFKCSSNCHNMASFDLDDKEFQMSDYYSGANYDRYSIVKDSMIYITSDHSIEAALPDQVDEVWRTISLSNHQMGPASMDADNFYFTMWGAGHSVIFALDPTTGKKNSDYVAVQEQNPLTGEWEQPYPSKLISFSDGKLLLYLSTYSSQKVVIIKDGVLLNNLHLEPEYPSLYGIAIVDNKMVISGRTDVGSYIYIYGEK